MPRTSFSRDTRCWVREIRITGRCTRHLYRPRQLFSRLYTKTFGPPAHMHAFVARQLTTILEEAGFSNVHTYAVQSDIQMFEAHKVKV